MRLLSKRQSGTQKKQIMSGRGHTQRNARRPPEKSQNILEDDYEDPLEVEGLVVKSEVSDIFPEDILPSNDEDDEMFGTVDGQDLVAEHQRIMYNKEINDQRNVIERLGSLERKVDFLLNLNSKILARVDKLCGDMKEGGADYKKEFPVADVAGLEAIDEKIANNRRKYIDTFRAILQPHGIIKNIGRLFVPNLLMQMNYSGVHDKIALNNYHNLNMALFEAQRTEEGFTIDDHMKLVREAFIKVKNRVYKEKSYKNKEDRIKSNKEALPKKRKLDVIGVLCGDMKEGGSDYKKEFPVVDVAGLKAIDKKIANNRTKYIDTFRAIIEPDGIIKNIERLFVRNLLMKMNYSGIHDKIALNSYQNLNTALFEAQRTEEDFTMDDHTKLVREAFTKVKSRCYKAKSVKNKIERIKSNNEAL